MPTDSQFTKYAADVLRLFRDQFFPNGPEFPQDPEPPVSPSRIEFGNGLWVEAMVTRRPRARHLTVAENSTVVFGGGNARWGLLASDLDSWSVGASMPGHVPDPAPALPGTPVVLSRTDALVLATKAGTDHLEEAVLVEVDNYQWIHNQALAPWPTVIQGATERDAAEALSMTGFVPETSEGWDGGAGRAHQNCKPPNGELGYGGKVAEKTSFLSLLLCSDLPPQTKVALQQRMLYMAEDLEQFNIAYPANGGHGNGRYILWLLRQAVTGRPSRLREDHFSEMQQVTPYGGVGSLDGLGFRHYLTSAVDMASPYFKCCTANRWSGAALLLPLLGIPMTEGMTRLNRYTKAYMQHMERTEGLNDWVTMHSASRQLLIQNRQILGW